jgi:predicted PurR-regulated permease PerM
VSFAVLTPVLLFYLLVDIDRIRGESVALLPASHRESARAFLSELDGLLAGYLRGQLVVSLITGAATGLLLAIVGAPYPILLGLATALLNLLPVVGFWVGLAIALLTTALAGDAFWPTALFVALVYVGVQQLEGHVLSPRIVGKEVGLHPVLILLGILFFGSLFGLIGVIVAVPLTAVARMLVRRALALYRKSGIYAQDA